MSPFSTSTLSLSITLHQVVVADGVALAAEVMVQVDHHAAALRAVLGEVLDAERLGLRCLRISPRLRRTCSRRRARCPRRRESRCRTRSRALPSPSASKRLPTCAKRVPLRRVLQREQHHVVAHHVGEVRVVLAEREAEVLLAGALAVAHGGRDARRVAARVEHVAAGIVERQRQAEADALLHLGHALQHLLARHVVHAPALVVGAELAPVGARGSVLPSLVI